jgi:hypothetical protein
VKYDLVIHVVFRLTMLRSFVSCDLGDFIYSASFLSFFFILLDRFSNRDGIFSVRKLLRSHWSHGAHVLY